MSYYFEQAIFRLCLICLGLYMCFAQPGLPACWLQAESCAVHTHFNAHAEAVPHRHDYLVDLTSSLMPDAQPQATIPASMLIRLLYMAGASLLFVLAPIAFHPHSWIVRQDPPPPRLSPRS
jgi:hypothetical protein